MSKLSAIHKQIAALQAEAERITKQEMSAAIVKVKGLMSDFGLTIEHLTQSVVDKAAAKKMRSAKATKAKTASVAKYADPKTGKTWSGFGRAPGWIADAKNRDEFLVGAVKAAKPAAVKKASTKAVAPAKKSVKAKAAAKPVTKKAAARNAAAKKKPATKVTASKKAVKVVKKAAARKAPASASSAAPGEAASTTA